MIDLVKDTKNLKYLQGYNDYKKNVDKAIKEIENKIIYISPDMTLSMAKADVEMIKNKNEGLKIALNILKENCYE